MFWRFGSYANISTLESILDKPDVTIEELLEESDLIQELKQQNSKLIEFLRDEPVLKRLLDYVVADKLLEEVPPIEAQRPESKDGEEKNKSSGISFFAKGKARSSSKASKSENDQSAEEQREEQRKKYSYLACEVLSSEVWSLTEALMEQQDHLREFWSYLRRPAPLDALQAGYFTKVNEALLDKKTEEMLDFFKSLDGIIPVMLQHVDCPMVMDLLLKIISLEKTAGGQGIVDWLQRQNLIPQLLTFLSPHHNSSTQTSAGDFLKAIITISANATPQDQSVIGPNELTRQLVSRPCIEQLIDNMLLGGNSLTVGVGIIIEVIRKNNSDYDLDSQVGPEPKTTDPIYLGGLLRQFADSVPQFMDLIRSPKSKKTPLKTAFGGRVEPLGFDRFKTCELMAELLHCSNMALLNEPGAEGEVLKRDADREKLKSEGKLATPKPPASPSQVGDSHDEFGSSVDSHGFHHARLDSSDEERPEDITSKQDTGNSVADEDGFEQVPKPSAVEDLPDEVSFDEFHERVEENGLPSLTKVEKRDPAAPDTLSRFDPPPSDAAADSPTAAGVTERFGTMDVDEDTVMTEFGEERSPVDSEDELERELAKAERPAPLFAAKKSSPAAQTDGNSDAWTQESQAGIDESTATLHADELSAGRRVEIEKKAFETEPDGRAVVGDYLKIQFVEHQVVPTILDFFFRFPWNNFLHNVVYDVMQQVFNGILDRGYNSTLAFDVFRPIVLKEGQTLQELGLSSDKDVTDRILEGQKASDESQAQRGMRLGYMGHLTLVAEEVCKFGNRQPPEILDPVVHNRINREEWSQYVGGTLTETREKDNAVLGGVRPENAMGVRQMGGGFSTNTASALANAGLGGTISSQDALAMQEGTVGQSFEINSGSMLGSFGEADEDDDMENDRESRQGLDRRGSSGSHLSDDEQASLPNLPSAPAPLNIAPSGARKKLAARLAQRRQEAEAAAKGDPDAADGAAVETAPSLSEKPHEIDDRPRFQDSNEGQNQGLQITGMKMLMPGASQVSDGLFHSSDSDDSSNDSSDFDEDEAGRDVTLDRAEGDFEEGALGSTSRSRVPRRRLSTKEAKFRQPLDDEDNDNDDDDDDDDDDDGVEMRIRRPVALTIGSQNALPSNSNNTKAREKVEGAKEDEDSSSDDALEIKRSKKLYG